MEVREDTGWNSPAIQLFRSRNPSRGTTELFSFAKAFVSVCVVHFERMESRTLRPHRVVGAVCDDAASCASFAALGGEGFVTARVCHDAFHVVRLEKLTVQMTSPRLGRSIDALVAVGAWTYVALGCELLAFERCVLRGRLGSCDAPVARLLAVGDVLIAVTSSGVAVWARREDAPKKALPVLVSDFLFDAEFSPTATAHPPTYVNKIVVGSSSGHLELWNVRAKRKVHRCTCLDAQQGAIVALEPSGVLDVLGVARKGGCVELVHLRRDQVLFAFEQRTAPTCLAFARQPRARSLTHPLNK